MKRAKKLLVSFLGVSLLVCMTACTSGNAADMTGTNDRNTTGTNADKAGKQKNTENAARSAAEREETGQNKTNQSDAGRNENEPNTAGRNSADDSGRLDGNNDFNGDGRREDGVLNDLGNAVEDGVRDVRNGVEDIVDGNDYNANRTEGAGNESRMNGATEGTNADNTVR